LGRTAHNFTGKLDPQTTRPSGEPEGLEIFRLLRDLLRRSYFYAAASFSGLNPDNP
jgi:hypothetical protein